MADTTPASLPAASLRERLLLALGVGVMLALGAGFWVANGTRTFGELMVGAFSWCF